MELKKQILGILEKDATLSPKEISVMINADAEKVARLIEEMEKDKIIFGSKTLIDWDKVESGKVTAYIELNVTPEQGLGFEKVAEDIIREFPEVSSVSLMSGGFDILVEIEGYSMKDVALFVAEKIAPMPTVVSTKTHFVLRRYKQGGVVLNSKEIDERRVISL